MSEDMCGFNPTELQIDVFSSDEGRLHGSFSHQERITHLPTKKSVEGRVRTSADRHALLEMLRELVGEHFLSEEPNHYIIDWDLETQTATSYCGVRGTRNFMVTRWESVTCPICLKKRPLFPGLEYPGL